MRMHSSLSDAMNQCKGFIDSSLGPAPNPDHPSVAQSVGRKRRAKALSRLDVITQYPFKHLMLLEIELETRNYPKGYDGMEGPKVLSERIGALSFSAFKKVLQDTIRARRA